MEPKDAHCPHDKLFKNMMADHKLAADFFKNYLPAQIVSVIDFNSLTLLPNTYIDEALSSNSSDVLYQAIIHGQTAYIYLLCEHQSAVDIFMPFRLWNYIFRIWDDFIKQAKSNGKALSKLPLIVPMVFYHGSKPWNASRDLKDLIEGPREIIEKVLFQPFHLIDTNEIPDETFREQRIAGLMTFIMKSVLMRDFMNSRELLLEMIRNAIAQDESQDFVPIRTLLKYLLQYGTASEPNTFLEELRQNILAGRESMGNIAEYLKEEGRQEGRLEGRHQGEMFMLKSQLKLKFGSIPTRYTRMIEKAESNALLLWGQRILKAESIDEVFEELVHLT